MKKSDFRPENGVVFMYQGCKTDYYGGSTSTVICTGTRYKFHCGMLTQHASILDSLTHHNNRQNSAESPLHRLFFGSFSAADVCKPVDSSPLGALFVGKGVYRQNKTFKKSSGSRDASSRCNCCLCTYFLKRNGSSREITKRPLPCKETSWTNDYLLADYLHPRTAPGLRTKFNTLKVTNRTGEHSFKDLFMAWREKYNQERLSSQTSKAKHSVLPLKKEEAPVEDAPFFIETQWHNLACIL